MRLKITYIYVLLLTLLLTGCVKDQQVNSNLNNSPARITTRSKVVHELENPEKSATPLGELKTLTAKYLTGCKLKPITIEGITAYRVVDQYGKLAHNIPGWQILEGLNLTKGKLDMVYMGNPSLNSLLRERKTLVSSSDDAVAVTRLTLALTQGLSQLGDMWKYSATKMDGGWVVNSKYAGPPAMISGLRNFEILVNAKSEFMELREVQRKK